MPILPLLITWQQWPHGPVFAFPAPRRVTREIATVLWPVRVAPKLLDHDAPGLPLPARFTYLPW